MQNSIPIKTSHKKRRAFLQYLFGAVPVVFGGFILWIVKNYLFFRPESHAVVIGKYSQLKKEKIVHKKKDRIFLIHDADGLYVISDECTHLGCLLSNEKGQLTCHCHGSVFTLDGRPINGPAKRVLDHYYIYRNKQNLLVVDPTHVVHKDFRYKD